MISIGIENCHVGNKAIASVLLLYYHLIIEGRFCNDETIYLDQNDFDGFSYLNVTVEESQKSEISESLLREGAIIYLLCDLNDMVSEHEESFLSFELTQKIISEYKSKKMSAITEVGNIFKLFEVQETEFNFNKFNEELSTIFEKYVLGTFKALVEKAP
ncbi:hypothetical protein [uncultured Desulfuromusa sp.]|uniref:hypothetical protein n=1 Tax=uncultured Desulfuromusa sp. TaxID=219183 RepID=UPI002AA6EEBD|nr:hypothetical protein [uncultured Desulfuromusa sp.]